MKTFRDLNVGDNYYRLVTNDLGEVVMDVHDITNISYRQINNNERLKEFHSVHPYQTGTGHGCKYDEMDIQTFDLDTSFSVDGRGYPDIVYLADLDCLEEAKLRIIDNCLAEVNRELAENEIRVNKLITKKTGLIKEHNKLINDTDKPQFKKDITNLKNWFKQNGSVVFTEDEEMLNELINYMRENQ